LDEVNILNPIHHGWQAEEVERYLISPPSTPPPAPTVEDDELLDDLLLSSIPTIRPFRTFLLRSSMISSSHNFRRRRSLRNRKRTAKRGF
jgi:hypothetical protein